MATKQTETSNLLGYLLCGLMDRFHAVYENKAPRVRYNRKETAKSSSDIVGYRGHFYKITVEQFDQE